MVQWINDIENEELPDLIDTIKRLFIEPDHESELTKKEIKII
jgi:secreted Zn-dependent insulinase-like peptidase